MIKIEKLNNGFKVEGIDNVLYPDNGTLVFGANTVILVTDESEMVTFRSASNFDVLFSGLLNNITIDGESVTKDNIVAKFQAVANVEPASKEDIDDKVEEIEGEIGNLSDEVALKANATDLLTLFDGAEYNSQTKKIVFKHGDTVLVQIDATDFIKDGMISNVEIVDNKLVISFNTDAGKENIEIPLSEIFNPNDYYTKTQIDAKEQSVNASIALKANTEDVYDKQTADSTFATQTVVNEEIAARIQRDSEIEQSLASKADKSDTYSKSEVDDAIANVDVSDQLVNYETIANHNADKATLEASIALKANSADLATVATSGSYNDLSDKPAFPDTSEFVTKDEYNPKEVAIAEALTDLNENKADKSEIPDVSTFATKTELNAKQDALVSGTNIKTINGNSILGEGNIEIQGGGGEQQQADWNQTDSTAVDYIKNKPTNVSAFTNDAGYLTQHQSLNDYYTKSEIDAALEGKEDAGDALTDIRKVSSTQISGIKGSVPSTTITFKTINNIGLVGNGNISVVETSELNNYYTKTEIDAMVGNINTILASI